MKPALRFLIITLFAIMPSLASGGVTGNVLKQKCEPINKLYDDPASLSSKEGSGVVYCIGYIDSFIETFDFQVKAKIVPGLPYCLPVNELTKKEIVGKVLEYLGKNPDELGKPAGYHIFMALRDAYPCNQMEDKDKNTENKAAGDQ